MGCCGLYESVHGGKSTFINLFDKTKIFVFISPTDAAPQFLQKLEIHYLVLRYFYLHIVPVVNDVRNLCLEWSKLLSSIIPVNGI